VGCQCHISVADAASLLAKLIMSKAFSSCNLLALLDQCCTSALKLVSFVEPMLARPCFKYVFSLSVDNSAVCVKFLELKSAL